MPETPGMAPSLRALCEPELIRYAGESMVRLRAHVIGHVGSDGGVHDRCGSRVLESSLMLHLLREEGLFPGAQRGIVAYLKDRQAQLAKEGRYEEDVTILESALIDTMLGEGGADVRGALELFDRFEHFSSPRKQFMFHTLLTELRVVDSEVPFDLSAVRYDLYATWVNVEMCALKILRADQQNEPDAATAADRRFLMDQLVNGSDRQVFEADVFAHVVALLGARRVDPDSPLIREGVDALLRCQNPDGGFPFIAGWEPFGTAVTGLGLAAAGADPAMLTFMAEFLVDTQGADGGWGYAPGVRQSDADCSPFCLQFLRVADAERFAPQISRAEQYLLRLVNDDGGFGSYRRGDDSEIGVTGSSVVALAPSREAYPLILDDAVRYLIERQKGDGTYERGWSLCEANAMFRALFALRHDPDGPSDELQEPTERAVAAARAYLEGAQNADGGWGQRAGEPSDVLSTAYSLLTLTRCSPVAPQTVRKGLAWLVSQQERDGGFSSIPDSAGPRPLPHDLPVLADGYTLLALGHVLGQG